MVKFETTLHTIPVGNILPTINTSLVAQTEFVFARVTEQWIPEIWVMLHGTGQWDTLHSCSKPWLFFETCLQDCIRNPNKLATFCPESSLQFLIIGEINRFCPLLIIEIATANSFQLWWNCCIDWRGCTLFWCLRIKETKVNNSM